MLTLSAEKVVRADLVATVVTEKLDQNRRMVPAKVGSSSATGRKESAVLSLVMEAAEERPALEDEVVTEVQWLLLRANCFQPISFFRVVPAVQEVAQGKVARVVPLFQHSRKSLDADAVIECAQSVSGQLLRSVCTKLGMGQADLEDPLGDRERPELS